MSWKSLFTSIKLFKNVNNNVVVVVVMSFVPVAQDEVTQYYLFLSIAQ